MKSGASLAQDGLKALVRQVCSCPNFRRTKQKAEPTRCRQASGRQASNHREHAATAWVGYIFRVFRALQAFLKHDAPSRAQAARALRTLFMLAFVGQAGLAGLAWGVLAAFFTPQPAASPLLAQTLLGMAGLELPLALALGTLSARSGGQAGALSATLLQGILLATPVWFALFTWLVGSPARYPALLLALAALYYALGLLFVGRHAAQAQATVTDAQVDKTVLRNEG